MQPFYAFHVIFNPKHIHRVNRLCRRRLEQHPPRHRRRPLQSLLHRRWHPRRLFAAPYKGIMIR